MESRGLDGVEPFALDARFRRGGAVERGVGEGRRRERRGGVGPGGRDRRGRRQRIARVRFGLERARREGPDARIGVMVASARAAVDLDGLAVEACAEGIRVEGEMRGSGCGRETRKSEERGRE
ncbi:MAG TPA: hypothetical protein VM889_10800 [Candidatus Thermoplasmatota archaeon]|nr:hypothetical protein [Candidatus Thermoplasmatota archaeon]